MTQFLMATNIVAMILLTNSLREALKERSYGWAFMFAFFAIGNAYAVIINIPKIMN